MNTLVKRKSFLERVPELRISHWPGGESLIETVKNIMF